MSYTELVQFVVDGVRAPSPGLVVHGAGCFPIDRLDFADFTCDTGAV